MENAKQYQISLDKKYGGKIKPKERYLNPRAVLKHYCSNCDRSFDAKPLWLLNGQQPHRCFLNSNPGGKAIGGKKKRVITDTDKQEMVLLFKKGLTMAKIAEELNTTRQTVSSHLKKTGLK